MKYIKVDWSDDTGGYVLDAGAYLEQLPRLRDALPPGAREFAQAAGHYAFGSLRCVKDLELVETVLPATGNAELTISFAPNPWKHEAGLTIRYKGVNSVRIDYEHSIDWMAKETLLLDELLPDPAGCRHELRLTDSTIVVESEDLTAMWAAPDR